MNGFPIHQILFSNCFRRFYDSVKGGFKTTTLYDNIYFNVLFYNYWQKFKYFVSDLFLHYKWLSIRKYFDVLHNLPRQLIF